MVVPVGFEPTTSQLLTLVALPLSYGTLVARRGVEPPDLPTAVGRSTLSYRAVKLSHQGERTDHLPDRIAIRGGFEPDGHPLTTIPTFTLDHNHVADSVLG